MKLKNYLQFVKESVVDDIEQLSLWKLSEDDIEDYLQEVKDNGYIVTVNFGFAGTSKQYNYGTGKYTEKEIFDEKVLSGENVKPAYWVEIREGKSVSNEDVTDTVKFAIDMISENANAECKLQDEDGPISYDTFQIKGGLFVDEELEAINHISIFATQKESVQIKPKDLVTYYKWKVDLMKGDIPYVEVDLEEMADLMLSRRSEYKDSLVKGQEYMWDYYDISSYYPDRESLFRYELDKENQILLIKCLVKDFGGFEKFRPLIAKYSSVSELEQFDTEEKMVSYLANERYNNTILNIIKGEFNMNEQPLMEISDTIANWSMSCHCDNNYKEIIDDFDEIVGDEMPFTKVEKEVTKYYTSKDGERREYKTEVTFYQIPFDNKWIEDIDSDHLFDKKLESVFREWVNEQNFDYTMNPRLSDYGDVDSKKMNEDIRRYLERYLNKNG